MNAPREEVPSKVGRYAIVEAIGFGAMGAVYKAFDPLIKRTIAIKTIRLDIPPQSPHYRTFIERFYHEARISGTLSHPNIVTLFDIGETEDKVPFLAMEYVEGETVSDVLNEGQRFRPEQVIGLVSQMAAAIDYAHAKGVIHRDIKPSNIIVHEGEKVKVTDFGIAKMVDSEITHSGSLLGTPSYMSPEQAMGESLDSRSDLFSLGVVAFEMLSGQQPFPGNNVTSILYKLVHADPVRPPNLEVLGLLPDKWHQVFSRILSKNPADRYETGAVFVSELELCLGSWFGALEGETLYVPASPDREQAPNEPARGVVEHQYRQPDQAPKSTPAAPGNLVGAESREEEDEEVVFEAGGETMKDNPAFWGSSEATQVDAGPSPRAEVSPQRVNRESDTRRAPVSDGATRAYQAAEARAVPFDETRTVSSDLPPTQADVPAAHLPTRVARPGVGSQTLAWSMTATMTQTIASAGTLWKQKRSVVALVGGGLVLLVVGLAVLSLYLPGGRAQSPSTPMASSTESVSNDLPVGTPAGPVDAPARRAGILTIESEPAGASVLINGAKLGLTPLELSELEMGSYTVVVEKAGYESEEVMAELNAESPRASLSLPMRAQARPAPSLATVRVVSTPPGAQVLLDGKPTGTTPLDRLRARPGKRTIRLQMMGFEPWETTVQLEAGASESISAALEPRNIAPPPAEPVTPKITEGDLIERGPDVVDPKCIDCPGVPYPERARRERLEGSVQVSFLVSETGAVQDIIVEESGGEVFDREVIETLQSWRHEPATKNGVRVKVRLQKRFTFRRGN
ncbi:MAG TPA: TonB family protein [Vicinamibacteria bacterium]